MEPGREKGKLKDNNNNNNNSNSSSNNSSNNNNNNNSANNNSQSDIPIGAIVAAHPQVTLNASVAFEALIVVVVNRVRGLFILTVNMRLI
jgi:hypothetical protein